MLGIVMVRGETGDIEIVENRLLVEQVLEGVELDPGYDIGQIGIAQSPQGESYNLLARDTGWGVQVIGWHCPMTAADNLPRIIDNVTTLGDLPPERRHPDMVGKGIGRRLYNTSDAVLGSPDGPSGLYSAVIEGQVYDARRSWESTLWGKLYRIGQHAGKLAAHYSRLVDLEEIVDVAEAPYREAQLVIWNQPPRAALRQHGRGGIMNLMPPTFAIVRSECQLYRVGVSVTSKG